MIILDLMAETRPQFTRLKSYFGQPFIWCMLHNFGGTSSLFGNIDFVNKVSYPKENCFLDTYRSVLMIDVATLRVALL
jgi:Alpha-N-acetylglucosaminidase (NAGLU) tim-barrel domain